MKIIFTNGKIIEEDDIYFERVIDNVYSLYTNIKTKMSSNTTNIEISEAIINSKNSIIQSVTKTLEDAIKHKNATENEMFKNFQDSTQNKNYEIFMNMQKTTQNALQTKNIADTEILKNIQQATLQNNKIQENIDDIKKKLERSKFSQKIGKETEKQYIELLTQFFDGYEVIDMSSTPKSADIKINHPHKPSLLLEIKNYSESVPTKEISKFIDDIRKNQCHGILISSYSGIHTKKDWTFDIIDDSFIVVYLSNVNFDILKIKGGMQLIYSFHKNNFNTKDDKQNFEISEDEKNQIENAINSTQIILKTQRDSAIKIRDEADKMVKGIESANLNSIAKLFCKESETLEINQSGKVQCNFCKKYLKDSPTNLCTHKNSRCILKEETRNLKNDQVFNF